MGNKFEVGQRCVYPVHGVVEIMGIEEKEISGSKNSFYILNVIENDVTLMVPTKNAKSLGLRLVVPEKEVSKIMDILRETHPSGSGKLDNQSWNKRYRKYADKLKSGDIYEIATVLKDIHCLKRGKDLSFGEKKIMESALSLVVKELSISTKKDEKLVSDEIKEILS